MLKKLTATGIVAAAAAGFMLLGGTANADRLSVNHTSHPLTTYYPGDHGYGRGQSHHGDQWNRWDRRHHHDNHWNRWHHRDQGDGHRSHFHR
ncbi:MAG: hypothetical protein ACJ72W_10110 [Actinoallomurus sp.]